MITTLSVVIPVFNEVGTVITVKQPQNPQSTQRESILRGLCELRGCFRSCAKAQVAGIGDAVPH
jgi:hypothetical protein